jgi:hypothetical protein
VFLRQITKPNRITHDASAHDAIKLLADYSRRSFSLLREALGPLSEEHKQVITVIEVARIEALVSVWRGLPGRPLKDRRALSRAFAAKAVLGLPQTNMLLSWWIV